MEDTDGTATLFDFLDIIWQLPIIKQLLQIFAIFGAGDVLELPQGALSTVGVACVREYSMHPILSQTCLVDPMVAAVECGDDCPCADPCFDPETATPGAKATSVVCPFGVLPDCPPTHERLRRGVRRPWCIPGLGCA